MTIIATDALVRDDKYIVFKRDEFNDWALGLITVAPRPASLDDAVVIRTQDVFAGPALHTYAAGINIAIRIAGSLTGDGGIDGPGWEQQRRLVPD
jgi:hypothetical protein